MHESTSRNLQGRTPDRARVRLSSPNKKPTHTVSHSLTCTFPLLPYSPHIIAISKCRLVDCSNRPISFLLLLFFSVSTYSSDMVLSVKEAIQRLENRRVKSTRPLIPPQILQEDLPMQVLEVSY